MARLRRKRRQHQINLRRTRSSKLAKLRKQYAKVKKASDKEKIIEKVHKISPWLSQEKFLEPLKEKSSRKK
jgi:hypothetical protein